jgi:hypothetical protein
VYRLGPTVLSLPVTRGLFSIIISAFVAGFGRLVLAALEHKYRH